MRQKGTSANHNKIEEFAKCKSEIIYVILVMYVVFEELKLEVK